MKSGEETSGRTRTGAVAGTPGHTSGRVSRRPKGVYGFPWTLVDLVQGGDESCEIPGVE